MQPDEAFNDFMQRIRYYESTYQTVDEKEGARVTEVGVHASDVDAGLDIAK